MGLEFGLYRCLFLVGGGGGECFQTFGPVNPQNPKP